MPDNMPDMPEFPVLRKGGVDPSAVEAHLTEIRRYFEQKVAAAQARYANIEIELEEARKREEAVHLTLVAATKTKEELLTNAQREADQMVASSKEQADHMVTSSKEQAESLLAEAKKEAFRLVSEARESAEDAAGSAREEAKRIKTEAEEAAEATRNAARREAIEMIDTVESDTNALMVAQEATISDMRRKYEEEEAELAARVEVLRATAADLEARLKAIATGTLGQTTTLVEDSPAQPAATAPVTAPEPPTVAPKVRRPVRHDLMEAKEPAQASTAPAEESPAVETPAAVAEPVAAPPAAEEEAAPVATAEPEPTPAAVEEEIEETSTVVEPTAEVAEVEQVAPAVQEDEPAEATPEPVAEDTPEEIAEEDPVPVAVGAPAPRDQEEDGPRKGSYYSRRSAKLPRIGTEAGRSALAAANAIRGATRGEPTDPQDVTAQTA